VERRRLEIGRSDGEFTEVLAGLVAGEEVVSSGGRELQTAYASLR
jgi:multidrug efflux pump subunit AcrA (membrane-fusion protein)